MKYLIVVIIVMLFSKTIYSQNQDVFYDCSTFRLGKFNYIVNKSSYVQRDSLYQTSFYPDGSINLFEIKWLEECKFTLTFVKTSSPNMKTFSKGDVLLVTIDSVEGDCYTFTVQAKGKKLPPTQMCKVKE